VPKAKEHRDQVERNARFYVSLGQDQSPYIEWAITALFYIAVHVVEESFDRKLTRCTTTHGQRYRLLVEQDPVAAANWRILENTSRTARYDCGYQRLSERDVLRCEDLALRIMPRQLGVNVVHI